MKRLLKLCPVVIIIFTFVFGIIAKPHGFDDEGEISVPRSPKIQGDSVVRLTYFNGSSLESLKCDIEGTPTPTVIWLKDEKEIQSGSDSYNTTYNVTDGRAALVFTPTAYKSEKDVTGNFTCIAANFLGRAQKNFRIEQEEMFASNSTTPTNSMSSNIVSTTEIQTSTENEKDATSARTSASLLQKILRP